MEFERFAAGVRPRLMAAAVRILGSDDDAADAVQDTMLKMWFFRTRLDDYSDPAAPALVTVRRVCLDRLRSRREYSPLSEALARADESPDSATDPSLITAIETLPPVEQAVLRMKHIDGLETEEIASLTGSNPVAVRTALSRARKKVRDIYLKMNR